MNNYSVLQRLLHRLALSSQFMREVTFDLEQSLFLREEHDLGGNHVFIAGLARSGTTALLNAIYQSDQFASLSYRDMPFVLAPNFWARLNSNVAHGPAKERAHGDGIKVGTDSPEAFEEVFWRTFDEASGEVGDFFRKYVSLILKSNQKTRYLSKNNQNIRRMSKIREYFPESTILVPFRDPLQHANSLFSQHRRFTEKQQKDRFVRDYMNWIGHSEFGLDYRPVVSENLEHPGEQNFNHWLEQWYLTYGSLVELPTQQAGSHLICYESLCRDEAVWTGIKELLDIEHSGECTFRESRKDIEAPADRELQLKCYEVYEVLVSNAFSA